MLSCCICNKKVETDNGTFFNIPKDERRRKKWSEICNIEFSAKARICADHFFSADIVKGPHKVHLTPNAIPFLEPVALPEEGSSSTTNLEKISQASALDTSIEYVHINASSGQFKEKCRCCINPSGNFIQLETFIRINEETEKTFKDILHEITKISLSIYQEFNMPQQICQKCGVQLENSYKFIQQVYKVSQQYLNTVEQQNFQEDIKNIEHLEESLIEISETAISLQTNEELKIELLNIECNMEIKEEKVENDVLMPIIAENDESQDERDFLQNSNSDDHTSEDDEDSDDPESVKGVNEELNDETLARCCDICQKVYRNEKFLKIHKRYTHMPEEDKLPCPLCSYKASRSSALKVHMGLVHGHDKVEEYFKPVLDSGKQYPCNLCPRSYVRKDSLRKHVRRKHLNKPSKEVSHKKSKPPKPKEKERFLCTYCGQSYSSKCGLESHVLTHTGERPFSCEICSKTFKRLKDLQLHRVIHSDEKPHQCSECGKAFKRVDKLKVHMRVHSELRPYKCNECEKTFKYPSVLRTHMHIHTGQTPFACKTCGEAFSLRTSLNNHCFKNGHVK